MLKNSSASIISISFLIILLFFLHSCTKLQCNEIKGGDPLIAIDLFPDHGEKYVFESSTEVIELIQGSHDVERTDKARYMGNCPRSGFTLKNCSCSSQHYEEYAYGNRYRFYSYLSHTQVGDDPPMNSIIFEAQGSNYDDAINKYISFSQNELETELNKLHEDEVVLGNVVFNNVYKYESYEGSLIVLIKPFEGMVAFYDSDVLYQIVDQ